MEDLSKNIAENKAAADALTASVNTLYQKLGDLNKQQATFGDLTKAQAEKYRTIKDEIEQTSARLSKLNGIIGEQERTMAAAKSRTDIWGKAYEGATASMNGLAKTLKEAGDGFKPLGENIEKATKVISPFKDAIAKANQAYSAYADGVASGKGRMESLKDVFPALAKGAETGASGMKIFKIALAQTGIGLIVMAVAALMQRLQELKPVMDMINGVTASVSAVVSTLGDGIISLLTNVETLTNFIKHPIDSVKKLGKNMADAAKDAYNLSDAQDKLKTAMSAQDIVNNKLNHQISLLKDQAANAELSAKTRIKALSQQHNQEEQYYTQNALLAARARDNAAEEIRIKTRLDKSIIDSLKNRGAEAAIILLRDKKINEEQYESIKKADEAIRALDDQRTDNAKSNSEAIAQIRKEEARKAKERWEKELKEMQVYIADAEKVTADSAMRMSLVAMKGYELEIRQAEIHFNEQLKRYTDFRDKYEHAERSFKTKHKKEYEASVAAITALETEKINALTTITSKFRAGDLQKLNEYATRLQQEADKHGKNAQQLAIAQLEEDENAKEQIIKNARQESKNRKAALESQWAAEKNEQRKAQIQQEIDQETAAMNLANSVMTDLQRKLDADRNKINKDETDRQKQEAKKQEDDQFQKAVTTAHDKGDWQQEYQLKQQRLDAERAQAVAAATASGQEVGTVNQGFDDRQRKLDNARHIAQLDSQKNYLKSVSSMSSALGSLFGKNTLAAKAAFKAQQAAAAGQVIIDTQKSIMGIWSANSSIPFVGTAKAIIETAIVAATGASSLSTILKQKPGFAQGGQFTSDGKGALLSGYSRTDNTNAYLRSGEAVVVSEAMRNPWARNLVSAINVAHGGRDFSTANSSRGYAMGGVFTDGGNANRYYSQPVTDVKDLANTLAYQMINNFPPIYVDVKDVNNQQNILAQTVDRVNL